MRTALPLLFFSLFGMPAHAHGLWGHVHVTGWAVENMPDDELRAFLLDDPAVFNALLFGAVFADTGYARNTPGSHAYSEHIHWEPFVEDFIQWIAENDPPPWTTSAQKKRVAFLLGCASHGLQDAIFDSLFLAQIAEHDDAGQAEADPGTDGFLVIDGHTRFVPEAEIPLETVLTLLDGVDENITEEVITGSVDLTTTAYINGDVGLDIAALIGTQYADDLPWTRVHYLDPDIPGSLRAEIFPTMRYQQALWKRLHGELAAEDITVDAYPAPLRRLRSGEVGTADSWATLIFGAGVRYQPDLVSLTDADGRDVPFEPSPNQWGADPTRLVRLKPTVPLTPGAWYTVTLREGAALINGDTTPAPSTRLFQVACDDPAICPPTYAPIARIDGSSPTPSPAPAEKGCSSAYTRSLLSSWQLLARRSPR